MKDVIISSKLAQRLILSTGLQKTHNNSFGEHWDRNSNKSILHIQATIFIPLPCTVKLTDEMFRPAKFDA